LAEPEGSALHHEKVRPSIMKISKKWIRIGLALTGAAGGLVIAAILVVPGVFAIPIHRNAMVTPDTPFRIGTASTMLTSAAVGLRRASE
jgi:hypothetical protein